MEWGLFSRPDRTGFKEMPSLRLISITYGNRVFSDWQGHWGYRDTRPGDDGGIFWYATKNAPYGPPFRSAYHARQGRINLLREPVFLHNSCIRNDRMVDTRYREFLRIED